MDVTICLLVTALSFVLFMFPGLYPKGRALDDALDFFGYFLILQGVLFRMSARGHKQAHSKKGTGLVTSGLYGAVRNPMYLGSFMIGAGFVLLVWPWWTLPIYATAFYLRFNRQMVKEEDHLKEIFKEGYLNYSRSVSRIWPYWKSLITLSMRDAFVWSELWSTKEKHLLWILTVMAVVLEALQELMVYHALSLGQNLTIFACSVFLAGLGFGLKDVLSK
jgi:protein-S-isoprenylcysteine O-methyltransferase Ste14